VAAISDGVAGNRGTRDMVYDGLDRLTDVTAPAGIASPMYGTNLYRFTDFSRGEGFNLLACELAATPGAHVHFESIGPDGRTIV